MATIRDVAKRANVAISTVSAVLNRSAPVSEETIARVEQASAGGQRLDLRIAVDYSARDAITEAAARWLAERL